MADRLEETFRRCRNAGESALIAYVMGGDPNPIKSRDMALACIKGGADIVELGFPFSDPIADGPTIQRAAERALIAGTTLASVLDVAKQIRTQSNVPLLLMGYLNPVLSFGEARFFSLCEEVGVDGVILPDLPIEESASFQKLTVQRGISLILMLSPTSTSARLEATARLASGFLYFVSVTGVTGARTLLPPNIGNKLAEIRKLTTLPIAVGFGISTPEQVASVAREADGVVVGSAIVSRIAEPDAQPENISAFVQSLKQATRKKY